MRVFAKLIYHFRPPQFEFHISISSSSFRPKSSSTSCDSLKVTRVNSAKRIVSGIPKEQSKLSSKQLPSVSRFQQIEDDDQTKLDEMTAQLQNDSSLSEAKKYYLKKQIQLLKVKIAKAAKNE